MSPPPEGVWDGGSHTFLPMPLIAEIVYIQTRTPTQTLSLIRTGFTVRDVSGLLVEKWLLT